MSRWRDPLAALGLLLVVLAGIVGAIVLPARDRLAAQDAQIATLETTLAAFQARVRQGATPQATPVSEDVLLPAASTALAAATLQDLVDDAALSTAVDIDRVRIEDPVPGKGVTKIGLSVTLTGTLGALADLVHTLESTRPYVILEMVEIRRGRGTGGALTETVIAELRLSGFIAPPPVRP